MNKSKLGLLAIALIAGLLWANPQSADAQLVVVEGKYRVVSVDRDDQRIGIALPDADPNVRQNWLYIKPDTRISVRDYTSGGYFKDYNVPYNRAFETLRREKGNLIKIHGGRDWDGSIDAKKIWM